jgi:hypothetical protein
MSRERIALIELINSTFLGCLIFGAANCYYKHLDAAKVAKNIRHALERFHFSSAL